jgi:hypothetical protein
MIKKRSRNGKVQAVKMERRIGIADPSRGCREARRPGSGNYAALRDRTPQPVGIPGAARTTRQRPGVRLRAERAAAFEGRELVEDNPGLKQPRSSQSGNYAALRDRTPQPVGTAGAARTTRQRSGVRLRAERAAAFAGRELVEDNPGLKQPRSSESGNYAVLRDRTPQPVGTPGAARTTRQRPGVRLRAERAAAFEDRELVEDNPGLKQPRPSER